MGRRLRGVSCRRSARTYGLVTITVLTLTFDGRDGLSCLSRDVSRALATLHPAAAVQVLSLGGPPSIQTGRVTVTGSDGSRRGFIARSLRAAAGRPDLLVALHTNLLPLTVPFTVAGTPLVHVLVGIEAWQPLGVVHARALRRAATILAISHHTKQRFLDANGWCAEREILVAHPSAPELAASDDTPGPLPPGYTLIVGRMAASERYKGHDLLIDVWPRVRASIRGARLVMAGDGDDAPRLRQRVEAEGLSDAITFTGRVDDRALSRLYAGAGVFVLPSANEGFGYVFLEAMTSGCACIGAQGAAAEIIEHGSTGLVVAAQDASGLEQAVSRLLGHPDESRAMGAAGRERARTVFGPARFADDLRAALSPVLTC